MMIILILNFYSKMERRQEGRQGERKRETWSTEGVCGLDKISSFQCPLVSRDFQECHLLSCPSRLPSVFILRLLVGKSHASFIRQVKKRWEGELVDNQLVFRQTCILKQFRHIDIE
jgi:hypothetical protein